MPGVVAIRDSATDAPTRTRYAARCRSRMLHNHFWYGPYIGRDDRRAESMWTRLLPVFLLVMAGSAHAATEVGPDIWLIPGATPQNAQPDGNTVIVDAPAGLIVFDTGRHAAHTQ